MTWALIEPVVFGRFFLDGDYVGWEERLEVYFDEEMPPEEKEKYSIEDYENQFDFLEYSSDVAKKFIVNLQLYKLEPPQPHECPREFAVERTRAKAFGSVVKLTKGLLAVDADLMEIIEGLEPGVHQFSPLTITMPSGEAYPKQYYTMRIGRFLNSFAPQESDAEAYDENEWGEYSVSIPSQKKYMKLAVSEAAIGSSHLWRERLLSDPEILLSDALYSEIKKAGLKMPSLYKLKDVS